MLLYVHRDRTDYLGRGAQDGHLDFHIAPELRERVNLTLHFKYFFVPCGKIGSPYLGKAQRNSRSSATHSYQCVCAQCFRVSKLLQWESMAASVWDF